MHSVVDRIEFAPRQEIEVPAFRIECGRKIQQHRLGGACDLAILKAAKLDDRSVQRFGAAIREPFSIRREIESEYERVLAAVEYARIFRRQIDQHQLVAMIGQRDLIGLWRNHKRDNTTDVQACESFRF